MNAPGRIARFVFDNSLLLFAGAAAGILWANVDPASYTALRDLKFPFSLPGVAGGATLRDLVNEVLMAFFFALAAKEVWEAMLPGGALRDWRRAATPVLSALGGMAGPSLIYVAGALWLGQFAALGRGWASPCATDIAFSYVIARLVFGKGHPAVPFLLLLAIADDAFGLAILAIFYPVAPVRLAWLGLSVLAVVLGLVMRRRVRSFWWFLAFPGTLSWVGFAMSGLHPALGLLPIIPTFPHGRRSDAPVHWGATDLHNALDEFESWWSRPVEVVLGLFGFLNAGVVVSAGGTPTLLVLVCLLAGKPIGIFVTAIVGTKLLGLRLAEGIGKRELFVIGCAAGIGFTVAIFTATVAFAPGPIQDSAKLGALCSCLAALVAFLAARLLKIRRADPK